MAKLGLRKQCQSSFLMPKISAKFHWGHPSRHAK